VSPVVRCLALLEDLLVVPSDEPAEAARLASFCADWLRERGVSCRILECEGHRSVVAEVGRGDRTLVLNGHLDVVAGKPGQFSPHQTDGRLYGRGTADMKAGVAVMMTTLADLKDCELSHRVQLQLVTDEETGGAHGTQYLLESGLVGHFAICGEPTQLQVAVEAKGLLHLDLEVNGRSAHGSRPWEGENAILKAVAVFRCIERLPFAAERSTVSQRPSVNLAWLQGGAAYNTVPGTCTMGLDIRFLPGQDPGEILRQVQEVAGPVQVRRQGDPVQTRPDDPGVELLAAIVTRHTGEPARLVGQHGSADTRFFASRGIPAVELGPVGGDWHGDREFVDLASLETYRRILWDFALEFR
jgi:succinyl-diaminopimelate desuccinylase